MFRDVFKRKPVIPPTAPTEVTESATEESVPHVVKHPLTRAQAQERGALGNEAKRQMKVFEAQIMHAVAQKSPLLAVIGQAFPKLKHEVIWNRPDLLESLLKLTGSLESPPPGEDGNSGYPGQNRHRD